MRTTLAALTLLLASTAALAQQRVTAQEWEPLARQAAADATGATNIGEPGRIEVDPTPGDPLLADTTGAASGWKYYYTFGAPPETQMLTVHVSAEQEPVVSEPFSVWAHPHLDARLPLPDGWPDSGAFLAYAMAIGHRVMEGWVPAAFFEAYEDAAITSLTLVGHNSFFEDAVWSLEIQSASCNVAIRVLFLMSQVTSFHGGAYPGANIGDCLPVSTDPAAQPTLAVLGAPYPNPAVSTASVPFTLSAPSFVTLEVVDALGRTIATLVKGPLEAGNHTVAWAPGSSGSGTYFYRLVAGGEQHVRRMTLVR